MANRDVIVVGASAGGVEALSRLAKNLPADLPASVFVVLHIPAQSTSLLPMILSRAGSLPASHPEDGEGIENGCIYVAPPDRHLMIEPGRIRVVRGPTENRDRPAIAPHFRSAASAYARGIAGVVRTCHLEDGSAARNSVQGPSARG